MCVLTLSTQQDGDDSEEKLFEIAILHWNKTVLFSHIFTQHETCRGRDL